MGDKYGVDDQFLNPEYQGQTNFLSFGIFGFALGGFIMSFNLYTYILHVFRFPFIATLNRPFLKFSVNNFVLPLLYIIVYLVCTYDYQLNQELRSVPEILKNQLGFLFGVSLFISFSWIYFNFTNKNIFSFVPQNAKKKAKRRKKIDKNNLVQSAIHKKPKIFSSKKPSARWHVETYLVHVFKIGLARDSKHYEKAVLTKVFRQNHVNASIFEIALILSFILIGSFRENPMFVIPAAASVILFFTMLLMVVSALFSWIKGWTITVFILLFALANYTYQDLSWINVANQAYGLNYGTEKAEYSREYIHSINHNDSIVQSDFENTVKILHKWRLSKTIDYVKKGQKPKVIIINTSGGGLRSALWTMSSLLTADSMLQGNLLQNTILINGSSGGMIGASYLRELYYQNQLGSNLNIYNPEYCDRMAKDLLNPVIFSIATNDLFIRYQSFKDGDYEYTKDRGYSFEKQLNTNTDNIFSDRRLSDYSQAEQDAIIPMMVMAPTITNDGRRLLVSSQPVSYLTQNTPVEKVNSDAIAEDIEFMRLFKDQDAENLKFTSALRMNATFPYIMPIVTLPSEPAIQVMDAGMRDNYGMKTTMQYLYTFRNWINTNTSGVIVLQVRDNQKDFIARDEKQTLVNTFTAPLGSVYGNYPKMHNYNNDQMIRYLSAWFENDIDILTFQLHQDPNSQISLSWHLTEAEKRKIKSEINSENYLAEVEKLRKLLE